VRRKVDESIKGTLASLLRLGEPVTEKVVE